LREPMIEMVFGAIPVSGGTGEGERTGCGKLELLERTRGRTSTVDRYNTVAR
jgi:hypothetical protein